MKTLTEQHADLRINIDTKSENTVSTAKKYIKKLTAIHKNLKITLAHVAETQKKYYNKQHKLMSFRIKNQIMLQTKNICMICSSCKLDYQQLDLFIIINT